MELITINEYNGNKVVSARELHDFLQILTPFKDWIIRMLDYGFQEDIDFRAFLSESNGGRPSKEYALTLDCAKEISMIQRTKKGKEARLYFIECEKALKQPLELSRMDILKMALDSENARQEAEHKLAIQQPRVDYATSVLNNSSYRTANEIASDLGITANKLNSTLYAMGVQYKQGGVWMLYAKYRKLGYTITKTDIKNGHSYVQMVWSEKGRAFIHSLLNPAMIKSLEVKKQSICNLRIN